MNDNWSEIIEILKPIVDGCFSKEELKRAVENCLRMIGWKTSNRSMLSNYSTQSGAVIDLVLGEKQDGDDIHPVLPVTVFQYDSYSKRKIYENMNTLGSKIGLCFSDKIEVYYRNSLNTPTCVSVIEYDINDVKGSKLLDYLSANVFTEAGFTKYAEELYGNISTADRLKERISLIFSDKEFLKNIIQNYLIEDGFEASVVNKELEKYSVSFFEKYAEQKNELGLVNEPILQDSSFSTQKHDTTKFSIDGKNYFNKRTFVYQVVKQYVDEHENIDIDELEKVFPSEIASKVRGVVRPLSLVKQWIEKQPDLVNRYCLKPDEIITLSNGMEVVVYNQWGAKSFPAFLNKVKTLYRVYSSQPYGNIDSIQANGRSGIGISISEKSLENFSKKN